jgi:acetylornithine/N-succinyldiaminopimelate aminotransferase
MTTVNEISRLMPNYGVPTIEITRGQGAYLYGSDGKEYLDFTAGIAVCNLGHAHPAITEVISKQAATLLHISNLFAHPERTRLATRLTQLSGLDQAFFCNSGTEANEAALKLARKYADSRGETDRVELVSLPHGFHGRTLGALSITPKPAYHEGYRPLLPGCTTPETLEGVVDAISEKTAACILEVIQGEGGVRPLSAELLQAIQARCKEAGALLIVDEVQTGVGRTGTFFGYEAVGIQPDIVTMAKGLGNGIPVGAVLARAEVAAAFGPGSHGSTFGGNPLAMAVANEVLNHVAAPDFLAHVREVGKYLERQLAEHFVEVTGRGLMWGFTVSDAAQFVAAAARNGLLLTTAGPHRVRMIPPLIIEKAHVDAALEILKQCE